MAITAKTSQYLVLDDFLSNKDWEEVWKYQQAISYLNVGEGGWVGAWRLDDGPVMRAVPVTYGEFEPSVLRYPTGRGIDLLIDAIFAHDDQISPLVGKKDKDWTALTALPMLYPRDTGLYWHRDAANWTGSYTYYSHLDWNVEWGGALLVGDESLSTIPGDYGIFLTRPKTALGLEGKIPFGGHLDNRDANELLMKKGIGTFIMPKPNRLVILKGGNPHSVAKVNPAAGDKLRASVSGFFQKPKR